MVLSREVGEPVIVVIPTYNEKKNIGVLIEKIFKLGVPNLSIIVVDDNSPDETAEVVTFLGQKFPVKLLTRTSKQGLGTAYVYAFREALLCRPKYIIQMDADLSHNPDDILRFLENIKKYDVVLGSRYVEGGSTKNWGVVRAWISKFGNIYARFILGVPYRDLTSGFKCFRAAVLEKINLEAVSSIGYNFQAEVTYKAHLLGFQIVEIPITFYERKIGNSKFNFGIILESFIRILILRFTAKD